MSRYFSLVLTSRADRRLESWPDPLPALELASHRGDAMRSPRGWAQAVDRTRSKDWRRRWRVNSIRSRGADPTEAAALRPFAAARRDSPNVLARRMGTYVFSASSLSALNRLRASRWATACRSESQLTLEGRQHPDRDCAVPPHQQAGSRPFSGKRQPVVSVDTKKKELIGPSS